jgi:hypothetical protein
LLYSSPIHFHYGRFGTEWYIVTVWKRRKEKKREHLHNNIINAYMAYNADKFIVSRHLSSLFDKPLEYILKSDSDYLQCWLNTYDEAVKTQQDFRCRQSIAAKNFFKPRKTDPSQQSKTSYLRKTDPHHNISDSPLDDLVSIISIATTISYSISTLQDS